MDVELEQFQKDLMESVREMNVNRAARFTEVRWSAHVALPVRFVVKDISPKPVVETERDDDT